MAKRCRVAIFEDDFLLAEALSDALVHLSYEPVHCCGELHEALLIAATADFDLAIVDLDLRGVDAVPLLERLLGANIPTLVATSADNRNVPGRFAQLPRLSKPYNLTQLEKTIEPMVTNSSLHI